MSEEFELLQELLLSTDPNYADFNLKLGQMQKRLDGVDLAKSQTIERMLLALRGLEDGRTGTSDILALIRQITRYYQRGLIVNRHLWNIIQSRRHEFGIIVGQQFQSGDVEVLAKSWRPNWLAEAADIDKVYLRRLETPANGDGLLYTMSGWDTYQSEAQKTAVNACLQIPPGATLLVTLPTGAGKSLCYLLPSWQESQGGKIKGGTSLVIVPTVSLAIDQEDQLRRRAFFEKSVDIKYSPVSLTSSTDPTMLPTIRDGIKYGTMPLVFTSPEKIINSEFYDICLEAARNGTLNRLIIDEAHLVETWGASFRTEFQFMATYRQKLLEASNGNIRTILLSATISESTEKVLKNLFSEATTFSFIRADRLRPEISYWFDHSSTPAIRRDHVLEALCHLPRPTILYVTRPDDADEWVKILNSEGFLRVEAFSGKTDNDERKRIIREWNTNLRDIMVANSAFGIGVDKSDVRTVIHATLPENVDRYYQEVGRGGRDGCSSISLVCSANGDENIALGMTATARISAGKAVERWGKMQSTGKFDHRSGDVLWVDPNVRPTYIQDSVESQANQEWNEHTLLLMQRSGLIQILETKDQEPLALQGTKKPKLKIKLLDPSKTNDNHQLMERIEQIRQQEFHEIKASLLGFQRLVKDYTESKVQHCISQEFLKVYPSSGLACGGCPNCRRIGRNAYINPSYILFELNYPFLPQANYVSSNLLTNWLPGFPLNVFWDGKLEFENIKQDLFCISDLIREGCQQFILPEELLNDREWIIELYKRIAELPEIIPHHFFSLQKVINDREFVLYSIPTVVIYPLDEKKADELFTQIPFRLRYPVHQINIAHRTLVLGSLGGTFYDKVNGLPNTLTAFRASMKSKQDLSF